MGRRLEVRLVGADADLGRVAAVDIARLILGTERTLAEAARSILGRGMRIGRRGSAIESTTRLRLVSVERGNSVHTVFTLPDLEREEDDETLEFETQHLGDAALERTVDTVAGRYEDVEIANALAELGESLGIGTRYERIQMKVRFPSRRRTVSLDAAKCVHLRAVANRALQAAQPNSLVGTLVEADFEKNSAHLRTATGARVVVSFPPELAEEIKHALREQARLEGHITFDARSSVATKVELRKLVRVEQLLIGGDGREFWKVWSVDELRREQRVEPVSSTEELRDTETSDEDVDALFAALELEA